MLHHYLTFDGKKHYEGGAGLNWESGDRFWFWLQINQS